VSPQPVSKIPVHVEADHLGRLGTIGRPALALAELIWNSLDADASTVRVEIDRNLIGGIDAIRVVDDGVGMSREQVTDYFGKLGGSWKASSRTTPGNRVLHGKQGEGRFRAFALGARVQWLTRHQGDGAVERELIVTGARASITEFVIEEPPAQMMPRHGTTVTITNVPAKVPGLADGPSDGIIEELTQHFALYLIQYPGISLTLDGHTIDPAAAMVCQTDYDLAVEVPDGGSITPKLTIIEWKRDAERALSLCDEEGFTLLDLDARVRLPGYTFTAYVRSPVVRHLHVKNELALKEMNPVVRALADGAREKIKDHFRERKAAAARTRVESWKSEKVYPYQGAAESKVEVMERQVFEVCAVNVEMLAPEFQKADTQTKALTFRLLRQAVEKSPEDVQKIFTEVLGLPTQKQKQFARLLDRTSLAAIINASSVVADRLEFIQGLESILFDPELKGLLKERTQLHKLLERNTWIFGEEFHLTASDEGLTKCLGKHIKLLTGKEPTTLVPVKTSTGQPQILDLFLSRRIQLLGEERHHLVVELKRPTVKVDSEVLTQVKKYARSVSADERFSGTRVRWTFWAVSNEMDDLAQTESSQANRPLGVVQQTEGKIPYTIWAKTWAQLLLEAKARLEFFREKLEYQATHESGRKYLREVYDKFLPGLDAPIATAGDGPESTTSSGETDAIDAGDEGSFALANENAAPEPDSGVSA
jgi:hypothetical protein